MAQRLTKIAAGDGATKPLNVMFFVEPFPVRCRPLDFEWVLKKWKTAAEGLKRRGHQATFVSSDALVQAGEGFSDFYSPASMGIPTPCYASREACDDAWCELMRDPNAQPWRAFIASVFDAARPDVVVTWTYNAPLRAEAAARGKLVVHAELGPVRAPHCRFNYFDPVGLNSETVLDQVWPRFRDRPLTAEQLWQVNTLLREFIVRPADAYALKNQLTPYGKPLLVYFLQVRRDSNMLNWSPAGNVPEMLHLVQSAVDTDKFTLLVRPHPLDPEAADLVRQRGMTLAPESIPTSTLTSACDLTLTCNSAVGFEALCQGKIVYALGQSVYAGRGVTRDFATCPEALRQSLLEETFTLAPHEVALRQRFLHFMFFRYLVPERSFWDADALALRLERMIRLWGEGTLVEKLYQEAQGISVLHELRAIARQDDLEWYLEQTTLSRTDLANQLDCARAELSQLRSHLSITEARLALIENSASQRVVEQVRSVPGLHAFYVGAKQVVGRLKPVRVPIEEHQL